MTEEHDKLNNNWKDYLVSVSKVSLGLVPYAGSMLSEIIGNVIPNQRINRISKFLKILDSKISTIPVEKINMLLNSPEFSNFLEEGFYQASRAITDERREYISNIIFNGLSEDKINLEKSNFLLVILNQLSDSEIIWLKFYSIFEMHEKNDFLDKHSNILQEKYTLTTSTDDDFVDVALQRNQKENLERLELVRYEIDTDSKTKQPKISKGVLLKKNRRISPFGIVLLKNIGLGEGAQLRD